MTAAAVHLLMPGPLFREGERVELRPVEPDDVEFLQRLVNHPEVRAGTAQFEPLNGPAEADWVERRAEEPGANFLVTANGDRVGTVGVVDPNDAWGTAELGYMVAPAEWGNGYATDAAREAAGWAFEERGLEKLTASAYAHNEASRRVLEKVGFTEEGVLRAEALVGGERVDLHRYGLLVGEFLD
jgi:ribosomal-protein-alanine N-acetyltransferase